LRVDFGQLSLSELRLGRKANDVTVYRGEQLIAVAADQVNGYVRLRFPQPLSIAAGETLTVLWPMGTIGDERL